VLIFLHGFPDSHRTWRHQIAHLSGAYRCIAPDQRGYRGSSKPKGVENYTPDKLIGDVFQLADALDVGPFTVVGHDWGGAIAWGVAIMGQLNGRVSRAVVMNAPHPVIFPKLLYTNRQQRQASQYFRVFRDPASDELVEQFGLGGVLLKAFGEMRENPKMDADERAALMEDYANREAAIAMLNWYRASPMEVLDMDAPYEIPAGWQPPAIPKLTIPTLVIWAMDDIALPPANIEGLDEVIEDLTLVKVPGSGHFVQWEAPAEVNAALDEFLTRT
jgi:pimeloyl-ACP methyl ester carboxylesterase